MSLCADAAERGAGPGDDVVRVEAVEPRRFRASHKGCGRTARTPRARKGLPPTPLQGAVGVVHVEVGDPGVRESLDVRRRARRSAAVIGLEMDCHLEPSELGRLHDEREAMVLRGDPAPHHETTTVVMPAAAISRICAATIFAFEDE